MNLKPLLDYFMRVGDAISQLLNVVLFNGEANESLSGRSYRQQDHWFWGLMRRIIDLLFKYWTPHHCMDSYLADLERAKETAGV